MLLLYLQIMMKHLMSVVNINLLSPSQVIQGAWSRKATRLGMVSGLGNLIPFENHP